MNRIKKLALEYLKKIKESQKNQVEFYNQSINEAINKIEQEINYPLASDDEIILAFQKQIETFKKHRKYENNFDFLILSQEFVKEAQQIQTKFKSNGEINQKIPNELLIHTASYLDPLSLSTAKLVCNHWNKLIRNNEILNDKSKKTTMLERAKAELKPILDKLEEKGKLLIAVGIIGQKSSGKTTLSYRLAGKHENPKPSFGNEFEHIELDKFHIQIWTIDMNKAIVNNPSHKMIKEMDIIILCLDGSNPSSSYMEQMLNDLNNYKDKTKLLVCTKTDLHNKTLFITSEKLQELANQYGAIASFKCSGKTGEGIGKLLIEIIKTFVKLPKVPINHLQEIENKITEKPKCLIM